MALASEDLVVVIHIRAWILIHRSVHDSHSLKETDQIIPPQVARKKVARNPKSTLQQKHQVSQARIKK